MDFGKMSDITGFAAGKLGSKENQEGIICIYEVNLNFMQDLKLTSDEWKDYYRIPCVFEIIQMTIYNFKGRDEMAKYVN